MGKYYRLVFRTIENVSFSVAFDVEQISKADENSETGKMLDVRLISDDSVSDYDNIGEMCFYYKQ